MNRIIYGSIFLLFLYGFTISGGRRKPKKVSEDHPNILLIISDDLTWSDSEPYGNKEVKTPNLAKLADEGITFYGMHTATAMCSPTRQQLYSGMFPVRNGAYPNHSWSYKGVKSLPHYLRPLGYRVGIAGKHDFGPSDSYPFDDVGKPGEMDANSMKAIRQFMNKDDKQPFALVMASHQPHKRWTKGQPGAYDANELAIPPWLVDTPVMRKQLTKYYAEVTYFDRQAGRVLDILQESGKKDNTLVIFTSEQGAQFPFSKWTCYENGLKTGFIVRWPGKVQPNITNHALMQYVDVVPTLIEAAGGDPKTIDTGRKDALGGVGFDGKSFLSVLLENKAHFRDEVYGIQTTLGIIGAQQPYPIRSVFDGRYKLIENLNADAEFSNITKTRDKTLIQSWIEAGRNNPNSAFRADFYYKRPSIEFYDVKNDPNELHNLAGDARYDQEIKELDEKLKNWMRQQGDEGLETEREASSRSSHVLSKKE